MTDEAKMGNGAIEIELDGTFFSTDVILKTCYWYTRQFNFDLKHTSDGRTIVRLQAKGDATIPADTVRNEFVAAAIDFSLRERVEARTSSIREILLAKAFAESGVLEDPPVGDFVDKVEHEKQDGLFKILPH